MRFPRFVPFLSGTWDIVNISIDSTKARLNSGEVYLPDDWAENGGELLEVTSRYHEMPSQNDHGETNSQLQYIIIDQNLELLELMMQLWAGFLRNGLSRYESKQKFKTTTINHAIELTHSLSKARQICYPRRVAV